MKAARSRWSKVAALAALIWALGAAAVSPAAVASEGGTVFAIIGDAGKWHKYAERSRDSILRSQINRLILPGDNLYGGTYDRAWRPWKEKGLRFDVVAIGNHHGGYSREVRYFDLPGEYFSKVISGARFIVLNSDNEEIVGEQAAFLERELAGARERFVFVVFHHPPLTVSAKHAWTEKAHFQEAVRPILFRYSRKITALLLGHDHHAGFHRFGDLVGIVSGAARSVRFDSRATNNEQEGIRVRTDFIGADGPYWVRLELRPEREMAEIDFVVPGAGGRGDSTVCSFRIQTGGSARKMNCPVIERVGAPSLQ